MANLTETPTYEAGIYRFETTDPVQGGPGGIDNLPTNQLANRTAWLKARVEAILLDIAAIESGYATDADLAGHAGNTSNPHGVTKAQVGLGSVLNYGVATQAEAEAGTLDTKYMTPLRAKQAIDKIVPAASETVAGRLEIATASEAQALADGTKALTPAALSEAFKGANRSHAASGFQRLPGGLILQWGVATAYGSGEAFGATTGWAASFPVAFPNGVLCAQTTGVGTSNECWENTVAVSSLNVANMSGIAMRVYGSNPGGTEQISIHWLAIGY